MTAPTEVAILDRQVRMRIYDRLITAGIMPMAAEVAQDLGLSLNEVRAAFRRLHDAHILVLQEATEEVLMANPFSAVPTPFLVETRSHEWWGNCIWDALGIAAMVKQDARISTGCGDCNDAMSLLVQGSSVRLAHGEGIIHFSVPARRWWDNIKFT